MKTYRKVRTGALPLVLALALTVGVAAPLAAQQEQGAAAASTTITFERALAIALEQNTTLLKARNQAASSGLGVEQAKMQFLPDLRLSTSGSTDFGRTFSQSEGQILNTSTRSMSAGVSSSLTLFNGFKNVTDLKAAQLSQRASGAQVARAEQTAAFTVAGDFLALVDAQEQLKVQERSLATQEEVEQQIERYVAAGAKPIADQYTQQATVASTRSAVVNARRAVEVAKVALIQDLQLDPTADYDFVAPQVDAAAAEADSLDLAALLSRALDGRADLSAQATLVDAAAASVKSASASRWPTVSLSAGYNSGFSSAGAAGLLDQLNQRRGGSVSLGVSIPLFDRGSTAIASDRADLGLDDARLALADQRQQVAVQVRTAYVNFQSAQQQLAAAQAELDAAGQALDASRKRYEVGAGTLVELSQAQTGLVKAQSDLVTARYNLLFQKTQVAYATGELDPGTVTLG